MLMKRIKVMHIDYTENIMKKLKHEIEIPVAL